MRARKWMPLTDFRMFGHVMSNSSEIFTGTLQAILDFETRIEGCPVAECQVKGAPRSKGVRFDVRANGDGRAYDVEMQCVSTPDLRHRARFYQALMDSMCLKAGQHYNDLPEGYVVFIYKGDALGYGQAVCSFSMADADNPDVRLHDGRHVVFVACSPYNQIEEGELRDLMEYINDYRHEPKTELVRKIAGAVAEANGDDATMATLMSEEAYAKMLTEELERSQAENLANKAEIERRDSVIEAKDAETERLKAELAKMGRS